MNTTRLPVMCLAHLDQHIEAMLREDRKPINQRNADAYFRGYAVAATYATVLNLESRDDLEAIREAVREATA